MYRLTLNSYVHRLQSNLLAGRSSDQDVRRHEFILNVLLVAIILACASAGVLAFFDARVDNQFDHGNTLFNLGLLAIIMIGLWCLSRAGRHLLAAYIFLGCLGLVALNLMLRWSFELPSAELGCALLVVISGLVLQSRAALVVAFVTSACLLAIGHAQIVGSLRPDTSWLGEPLERSNLIDYILILLVIGLVSWLAHLEIDRSLNQARSSEAALATERDSLEARVIERTRELEQTQLTRLLELQRFAEFGRVSAQLLHEIANPLTAASLNLEQLNQQQPQALRETRKSLQQLERYIEAARKQLKGQSQVTVFSAGMELKHLLSVMRPLAQNAGVQLIVEQSAPVRLLGDPVRFNQIVANLVVNAIDAYTTSETMVDSKRIVLSLRASSHSLHLAVRDWGKGISPEQLSQLFEPFYTTKPTASRGLGIGLSIVKQSVENDFGGSIQVSSSPVRGTAFHVRFKLQAAA